MNRLGPAACVSGSEDYRYTGKHEDPSGLYYFGARYYNPVLGRFTTRDTVFGDQTDPQSQNRYVYCRNNPQKLVDPDGRLGVLAAIGLICGARLLNAHLNGVQRQREYTQMYPNADPVHYNQEYWIGFDTTLTSGIIGEIDNKPIKTSRGVFSDVLEVEMENQQSRLGAPGYDETQSYSVNDAGLRLGETVVFDTAYDRLTGDVGGRIDPDILKVAKTEFKYFTKPLVVSLAVESQYYLKPIEYHTGYHIHDPWIYGR